MQAIFRMGVPVSGKNVFPSNIQGLPTWYEIRVNPDGHTARASAFDLMVAMNAATYAKDVKEVREGGYLLYDSSWPLDRKLLRDDITFLGVPLAQQCVQHFKGARERILMKNIAYLGAVAALLDVDRERLEALIRERYGRKKALIDSNLLALRLGREYALEHFECPLPFRLRTMDANADKILIDGNTAAALGCVYAGATVAAWYPITPATSLMDAFRAFCTRFRTDPETGKGRYCVVQAEDELAAVGMVVGAGWAGARAFTATAGPGISLMGEFVGLAYYGEVPAVIFDVQRTGPSTGMPTRTQQGDLLTLAYASHGDTRHICLYPANPAECFEMAVHAFDLAERFQTPVFVASDLDIGMNDWVVPRLSWDDRYRPDRGKVLSAEQLDRMESFYRYLDQDGDGIAARTIPGVGPRGAYFTRGSGHNKFGAYTEDDAEYLEVMERLKRKVEGAAGAVPAPVIRTRDHPCCGIVSVGSCDAAVSEAVEALARAGMPVDYLRVRGFPFPASVEEFLLAHELNFVVEMNRDQQLRKLLTLETCVPKDRLASVTYYGGFPLSCHHVVDGVRRHLAEVGA
jgi:2-oxoglutarate ferredoxin oxidoreductase subunit alpha